MIVEFQFVPLADGDDVKPFTRVFIEEGIRLLQTFHETFDFLRLHGCVEVTGENHKFKAEIGRQ